MKNQFDNLQQMLGNNYISEEPIDLCDLLALVALKEVSEKKNFADGLVLDLIGTENDIKSEEQQTEQANLLRRKLLELNWSPNQLVVDAIISAGKKCNPNETVFAYQQNTNTELPHYLWLEVGNEKVGLVHIIQDRTNDRNHFRELRERTEGLQSFRDLFDLIEGLLHFGKGRIVRTKDQKLAIIFTITETRYWKELTIETGKYTLPVGGNGFMVSLFPSGGH